MSDGLLNHRLLGDRGEVILLLNGGMMTHPAWTPVVNELGDAYRVLGCDFRGQLQSPGEGHHRLSDNVEDLVVLLDALELDRVHLLGTSFGGEVALLLAALQPRRVRTLAAVTAADRTPDGMRENARQLQVLAHRVIDGADPGIFHQALLKDIYSPAFREAQAENLAARLKQSRALPESWYRGLFGILEAVKDFDLSPWLGRIECPTLVVHAAQDAVMPEERVRALAEAIAGAELRIHPTSGHVLVAEDPAWLAGAYRDFLARHGGDVMD